MYTIKLLTLTLLTPLLIGCGSRGANHILIDPISAVIGGIENLNYNAKEKKVAAYAEKHYDVLKEEIKKGEGTHIEKILHIASVNPTQFPSVKVALKRDYSTIFHNVEMISEPIMQSFSRLYMPKSKEDKTMNGFTFTEAWNLVQQEVDKEYELLQSNVKNNQHEVLSNIADKLRIDNANKRKTFVHTLDGKYNTLYLDLLVVAVMIHSN